MKFLTLVVLVAIVGLAASTPLFGRRQNREENSLQGLRNDVFGSGRDNIFGGRRRWDRRDERDEDSDEEWLPRRNERDEDSDEEWLPRGLNRDRRNKNEERRRWDDESDEDSGWQPRGQPERPAGRPNWGQIPSRPSLPPPRPSLAPPSSPPPPPPPSSTEAPTDAPTVEPIEATTQVYSDN